MVFELNAALSDKLHILSAAAKYDVACTSSEFPERARKVNLGQQKRQVFAILSQQMEDVFLF